jgi:hypothetical protein
METRGILNNMFHFFYLNADLNEHKQIVDKAFSQLNFENKSEQPCLDSHSLHIDAADFDITATRKLIAKWTKDNSNDNDLSEIYVDFFEYNKFGQRRYEYSVLANGDDLQLDDFDDVCFPLEYKRSIHWRGEGF